MMWSVAVVMASVILGNSSVLSFSPASVVMHTRLNKASRDRSDPVSTHSSARMASDNDKIDMVTASEKAADIVSDVLRRVEGTDRGANASPEQRKEIDGLIEQLNVMGKTTDWLSDPKIFGNYNVAYVSTGSSQKGNPAGGRFRGRLGRALFRTEDLFQHLISPATAVNMVSFRVLGLLRGCVTLKGDFEAIKDRPNFVRASFEPPLLNFLGKHGLTFRVGPKSSVALAATYVDDRVRIGVGGRGSLFVFTRGGPADTAAADMWKVYTSARPIKTRALGAVVACGAVALAARRAFIPAGLWGLFSALLIFSKGGIIP